MRMRSEVVNELSALHSLREVVESCTSANPRKAIRCDQIAEQIMAIMRDPASYTPDGLGLYAMDENRPLRGINTAVVGLAGHSTAAVTEILWFRANATQAEAAAVHRKREQEAKELAEAQRQSLFQAEMDRMREMQYLEALAASLKSFGMPPPDFNPF
jgi:hypothetical protein